MLLGMPSIGSEGPTSARAWTPRTGPSIHKKLVVTVTTRKIYLVGLRLISRRTPSLVDNEVYEV
jgi:hypothetical protein